MPCYFYIIFSPSKDRFYIGHTCEGLADRLRKHNSNHKGFTGGLSDWEVLYFEEYAKKTDAYQREREVKSWKSRKKIEDLISK
ncbi:MAG: GIY-YIG nuclease family protein [Algoriphagus aquaeductus]|uniref:GIY-YIG nuclease family protein n=1 Tax=Algoriphagus TaxID=246875 RepID=UPI00164F8F29|nr:GIY-YIG nuclease family protein [Algoriphagus sp. AK58]MBC6368438.1 excinuclease ABC subunit C [Algoriphagus sp. AK58]